MFMSAVHYSTVQYTYSSTKSAKAANKFIILPESAENQEFNLVKQIMSSSEGKPFFWAGWGEKDCGIN